MGGWVGGGGDLNRLTKLLKCSSDYKQRKLLQMVATVEFSTEWIRRHETFEALRGRGALQAGCCQCSLPVMQAIVSHCQREPVYCFNRSLLYSTSMLGVQVVAAGSAIEAIIKNLVAHEMFDTARTVQA